MSFNADQSLEKEKRKMNQISCTLGERSKNQWKFIVYFSFLHSLHFSPCLYPFLSASFLLWKIMVLYYLLFLSPMMSSTTPSYSSSYFVFLQFNSLVLIHFVLLLTEKDCIAKRYNVKILPSVLFYFRLVDTRSFVY